MAGLAVAAVAAVAQAARAPAAPARVLHTVLQDDPLTLFAPRAAPSVMRTLRWLGVDYVRITAEWKLEAPGYDSTRAPRGFDPAAPRSYDASPQMQALDRAVRAATNAGLSVIIDPAFSAPLWATTNRRPRVLAGDPWYTDNIDPHQLATWEGMLARRYDGRYTPRGRRTPLPRVRTFTLWNEPNGRLFYEPQWRDGVPVSADWYRELVQLAYPAIKRASPHASVLIGNTSSQGGDAEPAPGGVAPLPFIRRLACVDARLRPVHDGACAHFRMVPADGFAHHPYERTDPPWVASGPRRRGWLQMGDLSALQELLNRLVAMRRFAPGAENLWLTEQGYESNAELTDMPWSEVQQAQLDAAAEYLAWRDRQVVSFSQFLLRDTRTSETLFMRFRTGHVHGLLPGAWTTGLIRQDGTVKQAFWMFRSPVVGRVLSRAGPACLSRGLVTGSAAWVEVWGRARPMQTRTLVQVQARASARMPFVTVRTARTDDNGIFDAPAAIPAGAGVQVRFRWWQDRQWRYSPGASPMVFRS
jgi:hypothetical protein